MKKRPTPVLVDYYIIFVKKKGKPVFKKIPQIFSILKKEGIILLVVCNLFVENGFWVSFLQFGLLLFDDKKCLIRILQNEMGDMVITCCV